MIQACSKCHSNFDNLKEQSSCPHKAFPKSCSKHNRFNCGNPECNSSRGELIEIKRKEA